MRHDLAHSLKDTFGIARARSGTEQALPETTKPQKSIAHQVDCMSRQVNYHLARARAAASGPSGAAPCAVAPCAEAVVRTLLKLHAGREIDISSSIAAELSVRVQREDFEEILGNLLDNACKWASSKVAVTAIEDGALIILAVDDDGPGLAPELRTVVLTRGVRLDETTAGSGLGLAIVRDLTELYGGSLFLEDSPLGGLRARVSLPRSGTV